MKINEFVNNYKRSGGSNPYNDKFAKALLMSSMTAGQPFDLEISLGDFIINYKYNTFHEWWMAGEPIIRSLGDSSKNEKYFIGFTDPRAINFLISYTNFKNVSEEQDKMFVVDVFQDMIINRGRLDAIEYKQYCDKNIKIHGDIIEASADACLRTFRSFGFNSSIIKLKDY